eukprot:symbB.v1.2.017541.t1/scaffold1371.1/size209032/13
MHTDFRYTSLPVVPRQIVLSLPGPQIHSLHDPLSRSVASLVFSWQQVQRGLHAIAAGGGLPAEAGVQSALDAMRLELKNWHPATYPGDRGNQLLFRFPRQRIGRELHQILKLGIKGPLIQCASHVASCLQEMSITPQEEKMWQLFTAFEVEEAEPGVLGEKESFGKHLHLRGGATGQIQLMQDWEWPYMFALADAGFQISLQTVKRLVGTKHLRILEIGWGQGISGRRLMDNAELAGVQELQVEYEVVELHPQVAADARVEAARRQGSLCSMRVHEGPWQKVMPKLSANSYDLIFYDPLNITPRYIGEKQLYESWGLPICVFEALQFYRLLRPGGVVVQYAISHRSSTAKMLQEEVAPLFRELRLTRIAGLQPEANSSYVTTEEAADLFAPALIK